MTELAEIAQERDGWLQMAVERGREIDALKQRFTELERGLKDRIAWLKKEAHSGGNWEHLKTRSDECSYVLQKLFSEAHKDKP